MEATFLYENKKHRQFIDVNLQLKAWEDIKPYFGELENLELKTAGQVEEFLKKRSELFSVLEEELAWRYIRMSCDTAHKEYAENFNYFVSEIEPKISVYSNTLNKKLYDSEGFQKIDSEKYFILIRNLKKDIEIFREENVSIQAKLQQQEQEYGKIASEMTIDYNGKEYTLQQAANYLKDVNRDVRQKVYTLISDRRLKDVEKLDALMNDLLKKRYTMAVNADFKNYLEFKFKELGRFDYGIDDCEQFHESIKKAVMPMVNEIYTQRKQKLNYTNLKPWDLDVDTDLLPPLKPFRDSKELIEKTITCFNRVKPGFGEYIRKMDEGGYFDLDSRKGKAPGGFNYPLHESNVPFIFMNSTGNLRDLETMVHEGGHAIHSFLSGDLELVDFKEFPSEVAELASMSMELISMEHWDVFFTEAAELKRAKRSQLEGIINALPWIAAVDKFQHWLYTHPVHENLERTAAWTNIYREFSSDIIDWSGVEENFAYTWQKQLHIFEVPLYYIEYGFAQLGAIAMWKQYKENPQQAIINYENALSLGYQVPINKIYETAGIKFDFSETYISELMKFVHNELEKLA